MSAPRSGPPPWLEYGSYALVALGAVSAALLNRGHIIGDGVDMYGTFWFFWYIAECVGGAQDPSHTDLFFYPLGKDIFAHTGNNFVDALVSVPFQWLLGFPRYQPVFVGFLLLGNALCFRPLARHVVEQPWAAWGATMLWQLAPFTLFELMTGRLTQAFLWFLPLGILGFLRAGEAGRKGLGFAVLAGVMTGLQGWTYWFMGYFMALAFSWLALVALVQGAEPRLRLLRGYLVAGLACVLTVAPAMATMASMASQGSVPGLAEADPGSIFEGPGQLANNVAANLHGYIQMETAGQPMLAYLVWGGGLVAYALFGRQRLRWLGVVVLSLFFAIGPVLPRSGGEDIVLFPYMIAYRTLPFFERLWFPYRLVAITFLALSLGLGTLLARVEVLRGRHLAVLPAAVLPLALVLTTMAEQHRHLAFPLLHRDLSPPALYELIGEEGGALIELPIGMARISIAFQPVHGQPTFGGMAENAPLFWPEGYKRRLTNSFIRFLRDATRDPGSREDYKDHDLQRLLEEGYRWVVLDRHLVDSDVHRWPQWRHRTDEERDRASFLAQDHLRGVLGEPVAVDGALVAWDLVGGAEVPQALSPTEQSLGTRTWPTEDMPAYEQHLRDIGRIREGDRAR